MKKIIAIALVLIMVLSLSVAAFAAGTKTVYCKAPDDWTSCYVHAWGSSGDLTGGWPGAPATKDSSTGLWKYDVPAEATNVIFHNNAGTQTGDLVMPTDNKVKFDVAANAWSAQMLILSLSSSTMLLAPLPCVARSGTLPVLQTP